MHEQSDKHRMIEHILDHPHNASRDPHERTRLRKRLEELTHDLLEQILDSLEPMEM